VIAVMLAAQELGANKAKVLKYMNSGDVTGDRSQVVPFYFITHTYFGVCARFSPITVHTTLGRRFSPCWRNWLWLKNVTRN